MFNPVLAKNDDDRRVDWLTFSNINEWTDIVKREPVQIGMVLDRPGKIGECDTQMHAFPR